MQIIVILNFFCLMDISAFMEPAEFTSRIDAMIDRIKACRRRPGVEEILVPGERSHRAATERRRDGVTLDAATLTFRASPTMDAMSIHDVKHRVNRCGASSMRMAVRHRLSATHQKTL